MDPSIDDFEAWWRETLATGRDLTGLDLYVAVTNGIDGEAAEALAARLRAEYGFAGPMPPPPGTVV